MVGATGGGRKLGFGFRNRKSFYAEDSSIEIGEDFHREGGYRLVERGRGYVRVVVLYEEEIEWLQVMSRKEQKFSGGVEQLGCLRGGGRTLICSRIRRGVSRRLELRLFAPYGRRIVVIPEMVAGKGWTFFADFLQAFLQNGNQKVYGAFRKNHLGEEDKDREKISFYELQTDYAGRRLLEESSVDAVNLHEDIGEKQLAGDVQCSSRSYLAAASLPVWKDINMRCHLEGRGRERRVVVNQADVIEGSVNMRRCVIGRFEGQGAVCFSAKEVEEWVNRRWQIPGGVTVKIMEEDRFLFIFPTTESIKKILSRAWNFKGASLLMDRWHSWGCCERQGWKRVHIWVRIFGLPVFLWNNGVLKCIGQQCGGLKAVDTDTTQMNHLKWARICVYGNGHNIPSSVKIQVGNSLYECQIWVEKSPTVKWLKHGNFHQIRRRSSEKNQMGKQFLNQKVWKKLPEKKKMPEGGDHAQGKSEKLEENEKS